MKQFLISIFCVSIIFSCKQKDKGPLVSMLEVRKDSVKNMEQDKSDTILESARDIVDGQSFSAVFTSYYNLYLMNADGDSIYKEEDTGVESIKFDDFNGDGYKDVRIYYFTNVPGIENLLLYNKQMKSFNEVSDFTRFPNPEKVPNTKLYYSYHRSGCADSNWDSDLFYFDGFKAVRVGNISGHECDNSAIADGIYIYKVKGEQEILIDKSPIGRIKKFKNYKWGYIKDYWTRNHKQFSP